MSILKNFVFLFTAFLLISFEGNTKPMCTIDNHLEFVYDDQATEIMIEETGKGCYLRKADLNDVNRQKGNFKKANLTKAYLSSAQLKEANFMEANLESSHLKLAILYKANLQAANLQWAFLEWANLKKANLSNADLRFAFLSWANLKGANLTNANLEEALYNDETIFPDGFDPKEAGMVYVSE